MERWGTGRNGVKWIDGEQGGTGLSGEIGMGYREERGKGHRLKVGELRLTWKGVFFHYVLCVRIKYN